MYVRSRFHKERRESSREEGTEAAAVSFPMETLEGLGLGLFPITMAAGGRGGVTALHGALERMKQDAMLEGATPMGRAKAASGDCALVWWLLSSRALG